MILFRYCTDVTGQTTSTSSPRSVLNPLRAEPGVGVGNQWRCVTSAPSAFGNLRCTEQCGGDVVKQLLALALVLATQAGDSSCAPVPKACQIDTRGIRVEQGLVTDVITAICDPQPRTHRLDGWMEYRTEPGGTWRRVGVKETDHRRPDAEGLTYAEYRRPWWPWRWASRWVARRRSRDRSDGRDYVSWTVLVSGEQDGLPPEGTWGRVVAADRQCGKLAHRIEFPDRAVTAPLPWPGLELIQPSSGEG